MGQARKRTECVLLVAASAAGMGDVVIARRVTHERMSCVPESVPESEWTREQQGAHPSMLYSLAFLSSDICLPPKMRRCCGGGMPSFSSTRSLMRAIVSSDSMSISISLPVSVLTLICGVQRPREVRADGQAKIRCRTGRSGSASSAQRAACMQARPAGVC